MDDEQLVYDHASSLRNILKDLILVQKNLRKIISHSDFAANSDFCNPIS